MAAPDMTTLDMGIWAEDGGTIWLPKELFPTRSSAKMFAVAETDAHFTDIRIRTRWMCFDATRPEEIAFLACSSTHEDAFECWEIT